MSLTVALTLLGVVVLVAVLLHGWWRTRHAGPRQARLELAPLAAERQEPGLGAEPSATADAAPALRAAARRVARLDALIDAIVPLALESPVTGDAVLAHLPPTRRAGSKPFYVEGLDADSDVLAVIHHESAFRKYAVSIADARGYMQVMPFWTRLIGSPGHNLFHLRTNLRYGCVILRHYIDREQGDLYRALGRYNGSLGRPEYPTAVMTAMQRYSPSAPAVRMSAASQAQ